MTLEPPGFLQTPMASEVLGASEQAAPPAPPSRNSLRPFACPACPSRFTRQENLNRHTRSVHQESNIRPFPCPHCDASFSRSDLRKRHVKKTHIFSTSSTRRPDNVSSQPDVARSDLEVVPEADASASEAHQKSSEPERHQRESSFSSQSNISWMFRMPQYISSYFEEFQPMFPMLHQPTIDLSKTAEPLLQAVACIGAVCHPNRDDKLCRALFDNGYESLSRILRDDHSRFREIWVLQAYVLFEYYAIYSCQQDLFPKALEIHRRVIDAIREFQLLQDACSLRDDAAEHGLSAPHCDEGAIIHGVSPGSGGHSEESQWRGFIRQESHKRGVFRSHIMNLDCSNADVLKSRVIYAIYYMDAQLAISCNFRPSLSALEIKHELPCADSLWSAPNPMTWSLLSQTQLSSLNINEEDDDKGTTMPRPASGDLYECLMHLIHPNRGAPQHLGLLWNSPFACLMLILQMQMMVRDLTLASVFFYANVTMSFNPPATRRNLSIISEENRAQIFQALHTLADLIPKLSTLGYMRDFGRSPMGGGPMGLDELGDHLEHRSLWHSVWIAWHYTAMTLTHQDALLTTGIVEYGLPTALSTHWELGKPRAKYQRDVYSDRDVIRIVDHLEHLIGLLNSPPVRADAGNQCQEDPFITMLAFKSCIMGWRVVRLMSLSIEHSSRANSINSRPNIYTASARIILGRVMDAITTNLDQSSQINLSRPNFETFEFESRDYDSEYLEWARGIFSLRSIWASGAWMVIVFQESLGEYS